jgi:hypothetical protein
LLLPARSSSAPQRGHNLQPCSIPTDGQNRVQTVHDPPEPTEEEQEQPPERRQEEEAMSGTGREDSERKLAPANDEDDDR